MLMPLAFLFSALVQFVLALVVAWILGPDEFGTYAFGLAAAILLQTFAFEWLRLAATRLHQAGNFQFARQLHRTFRIVASFMILAGVILAFMPVARAYLLAMLPMVAVAAGLADLRAALMRAEFRTARYACFMLIRNLISVVLMLAATYRFGTAEAGIAAYLAAIILAMGADRFFFGPARPGGAVDVGQISLVELARYAVPIVATNGAYLALFFVLRAAIAVWAGMAEVGRFSLAFEFGLKLFTTIGTALDLLLFQIAVREDRENGRPAAEARLAANRDRITAILVAMALGLVFVVPSIEVLVVSVEFRGAFASYLVWLLPALVLYALVQYAVHPFLQLALRTVPLVFAAMSAALVAGTGFAILAQKGAAIPVATGISLGLAMLAGLLSLLLTAGRSVLPGAVFLFRLGCASIAMVAALWPLARLLPAGLAALVALIAAGIATFGLAGYAINLADLRVLIRNRRL